MKNNFFWFVVSLFVSFIVFFVVYAVIEYNPSFEKKIQSTLNVEVHEKNKSVQGGSEEKDYTNNEKTNKNPVHYHTYNYNYEYNYTMTLILFFLVIIILISLIIISVVSRDNKEKIDSSTVNNDSDNSKNITNNYYGKATSEEFKSMYTLEPAVYRETLQNCSSQIEKPERVLEVYTILINLYSTIFSDDSNINDIMNASENLVKHKKLVPANVIQYLVDNNYTSENNEESVYKPYPNKGKDPSV